MEFYFCTEIEDSTDTQFAENVNGDDNGYYNIGQMNTCIRMENLRRVITEKAEGENCIFDSEYKVLNILVYIVCFIETSYRLLYR
jgi:hypothetical protein